MTMKRFVFATLTLSAAIAAQGQIYQWQDERNRTVISDRPPTGQVRQQRTVEAAAPAPSEAGKTLADRDMEFRKRQKESRDAAEKGEADRRASAQRQEGCEAARSALQTLQSGDRVAMHDSKGERYYLDDTQRQEEIAKARQAVQANCR
jgi:hypothetical protein